MTTRVLLIGWVLVMAVICRGALIGELPPAYTHALGETCRWHAKPWAARLGAADAPRWTQATEDQYYACQRQRGARSPIPVVKTILARWPSQAELAAMSRQDTEAHARDSLHPRRPRAEDPAPGARG